MISGTPQCGRRRRRADRAPKIARLAAAAAVEARSQASEDRKLAAAAAAEDRRAAAAAAAENRKVATEDRRIFTERMEELGGQILAIAAAQQGSG